MAVVGCVVRCWVKSQRAQPSLLVAIIVGHLEELPVISWRKVGMTSSPHGLTCWATHATMVSTQEAKQRVNKSLKDNCLDCTCNSSMKLELLVIVDSVPRECVPGLVHTARHTMGVGSTWQGLIPLTTV